MCTNVVATPVGVASVAACAGEAVAQAHIAPLARKDALARDPCVAAADATQGNGSGVDIGARASCFYHRALASLERLSGNCAEEITQ